MKKPKPALKRLLLLLAPIARAASMIGSCKKDNHSTTNIKAAPPAVAEAKDWYEKAYPASGRLATQSVSVGTDWSQIVKPDWNGGSTTTLSRYPSMRQYREGSASA